MSTLNQRTKLPSVLRSYQIKNKQGKSLPFVAPFSAIIYPRSVPMCILFHEINLKSQTNREIRYDMDLLIGHDESQTNLSLRWPVTLLPNLIHEHHLISNDQNKINTTIVIYLL